MLKIIGDKGKSWLLSYLPSKDNVIFIYDDKYLNVLTGYYVDSNRYDVDQLCDFIEQAVRNCYEKTIITVYTNKTEKEMETVKELLADIEKNDLKNCILLCKE